MADPDELDRLAARGRELSEREEATKVTPPDEAREAHRRVRVAVSAYARWGWWVLGAALGAGALTAIVFFGPGAWTENDEVTDVVAAIACGLSLGACFLVRVPVADRAVAREQAWAASLPFPLVGYPAALGSSATEGSFRLELTFRGPDAEESTVASFRTAARAGAEIDDALLADALRTVAAHVEPGRGVLERRLTTTFDFGESSELTNAHVRAWMHGAVPALRAIHARHPIAEVRVRGFER
ncbi:MAG: hypothetical protein K1X94_03785 [Sandaracinaceae bacterium]|nr:hypothetical protein [Sandaracinaceae bacterium]